MAFLVLVKDNTLQRQIQQHAAHLHLEVQAMLPPASLDYEAVLVDAGAFAVPDVLGRWDVVVALVHTPDAGEDALRNGAADYVLLGQIPLLLARRLAQYRNESQYILDNSGDGTIIVDDDGIVRYANPAAAALLGTSQQALIGQNFGYPISSGENTRLDIFRPGVDGPLVVEMRAVDVQWQGMMSHLATLRDVTATIEAEQELRLRDRAIHASSSAIFIIDATHPQWPLTYANPAFAQITGYSVEDTMGQPYGFLRNLHRATPEPAALLDMLVDEQQHNITTISIHRDGRRYWSELRFSPIYNDMGRLAHIVAVQNDITQSKILEQERLHREKVEVALQKERELNTLRDRFLTMMAHELHTPLASIQLSYDMLSRYGDQATPEERADDLENIIFQVNRLNDIVNDVLTISRSQKNTLPLNLHMTDIVAYTRRMVKDFRKAYRRTHRIDFASDERELMTMLDADLFEQALRNVLSNAVKFSSTGSVIEVHVASDYGQAVVRVRDEGMGIPEPDRPRLFEPFHRGENVGNLPGTGLGLTLVQQVMTAHEGRVTVESQVDRGTVVSLSMPVLGSG
ncbi:MAG: ATP-binding protein [Chloroflexota bacterium]